MFKKVLDFTMTPGGIDTAKLYPILMSSGLPREALGQIWATANRTTPGMLTKEELYTVLALIGVAQVSKYCSPLNQYNSFFQYLEIDTLHLTIPFLVYKKKRFNNLTKRS